MPEVAKRCEGSPVIGDAVFPVDDVVGSVVHKPS